MTREPQARDVGVEIAELMHAEVSRRGLGYAWGTRSLPRGQRRARRRRSATARQASFEPAGASFSTSTSVSSATTTAATCSGSGTSSTRARPPRRRTWCERGDALWASVDAGIAALRPGVAGWEVDAAARESLVAAGYPEPMYALGHQLGRAAHDGGTVLAPRWDRYGTAPFGIVEEGNVFTVEYGTAVPGRGYIGLEEDVVVTPDGVEWLSTPQRELWLVG